MENCTSDVYNVSHCNIKRHTLVYGTYSGRSKHICGTEFNNTANCILLSLSEKSTSCGSDYERCNYIGNRHSSDGMTSFARAHQSFAKVVSAVIDRNSYASVVSTYNGGSYDLSGCYFCSNSFSAFAGAKSCISTFQLVIPNDRICKGHTSKYTKMLEFSDEIRMTLLISLSLILVFND